MIAKRAPFNKRGVSEMISYVLLVVMAITLSVMVYAYLSVQVPKDKAECPLDTKLVIESASCSIAQLTNVYNVSIDVTLYNKGLRNVQAAYLRLANADRSSKVLLNKDNYFLSTGSTVNAKTVQGLLPGKNFKSRYQYSDTTQQITPGEKIIEIESAIWDTKKLTLCEASIIQQKVTCSQCGDGIINAPVEECDNPSDTCCSTVCRFKPGPGCTAPAATPPPVTPPVTPPAGTSITPTFLNPANGASFASDATIVLSSTTTVNTQVSKMEYIWFAIDASGNSQVLGTCASTSDCPSTSPYEYTWKFPAGRTETRYQIMAKPQFTTADYSPSPASIFVNLLPPSGGGGQALIEMTSPVGNTYASSSSIPFSIHVTPPSGQAFTGTVKIYLEETPANQILVGNIDSRSPSLVSSTSPKKYTFNLVKSGLAPGKYSAAVFLNDNTVTSFHYFLVE